MTKIAVIIPAFNEAHSIGQVVAALPKKVDQIIVADNASTDATAKIAREHGAVVVHEKKKGYGYACLKGMAFLEDDPPEIVVFLDGDNSDYPEDLETLVDPILKEAVVFSLGARDKKLRERGALTPQQVFGNGLACFLMRWLYKSRFTDLGPFRAIRWETLQSLEMQDKTYGWTVEMQLKILRRKLPYIEIPVRYRKRIGVSKVSGTVKGTLMAGYKIITWIGKFYFSKWK
ncbi:glycosyltransferase family 2 protein [Flavobacteriaceae bacterium]|jgi:glycosyltransferase involved in cell wall biosynthesis|nr:glycosyltransferase family 2 protein [Flavobacteriaceae bacterium]